MLQGLRSMKCGAVLLCLAVVAPLHAAGFPGPGVLGSNSWGQAPSRPPYEDRFIDQFVPDVTVTATSGTLRLSRLWQEKPLVVTMVYTRCGGVCWSYLRSLRDAVNSDGGAGRDYRVLVLTFDSRDTVEDMTSAAKELRLRSNPAWVFGVAAPGDIQRLASAMGYWFRWNAETDQFDHTALLVGIKDGRLLRLLAGTDVPAVRFREVADEIRGRFVRAYPLPSNVARFRCFQYDARGRLHLDWGILVMFIPATSAIACTAFIFSLSRRSGRAHV